jgi:hypothetical protein
MKFMGISTTSHFPGLKKASTPPPVPPKDQAVTRPVIGAGGAPIRDNAPNPSPVTAAPADAKKTAGDNSPFSKQLPPLPEGEGSPVPSSLGHGSSSSTNSQPAYSGTAPWLNLEQTPSRPALASETPPASIPLRPATGSVSSGEFHRVDTFWAGMDGMIDRKLGPGNDHDMKDLLKATEDPLKRFKHPDAPDLGNAEMVRLLLQHPAVAGGEPRPIVPIPSDFRNAPRNAAASTSALPDRGAPPLSHSRDAERAPDHASSASDSPETEADQNRAMWKEMRKLQAEQKRNGGGPEGGFLP